MAARRLCEAIDLTEPEPRSFGDFFGREKWIKRSRQYRRRHTNAGIADDDHHIGTGFDLGIAGSDLSVDGHVLGFDGDPPATRRFDELTHFSAHQFFYMVSRNRSTCGVRPYIRATCNPDADSWVAEFLAWWIDQETGLPIPERAGVLRYYIRVSGKIVWADRPEELMQYIPRPAELPPGIDLPQPVAVVTGLSPMTDSSLTSVS